MTNRERNEVLILQNNYRERVALGLETFGKSGPLPKASNMRKMLWDKELELMAQRWADQCIAEFDACRDIRKLFVFNYKMKLFHFH